MTNDLEQELGVTAPSADQLKSVEQIVNQALELMRGIEGAEEYLKLAKSELHAITTRMLPDALASAGTSAFTTDAGVKVSIKDFINGSLPKDQVERAAALEWIASAGAEDIIKNTIKAEFGKGQDNEAGDLRGYLEKHGWSYDAKRDVHPQTLAAFARERMKKGEDVPLEMLGLFAGRAAKIEIPK